MPTRTTSRRPAAATRRHATSTHRTGRFSRTQPPQRPAIRGRRKQQKPSGINGLLSSAISTLPVGVMKKPSQKRGQSSKAKPAMALLAAAGAVLGRRQMNKRKERDADVPPVQAV